MGINRETIQNFRKSLRVLEREIARELESECCGVSLSQCHVLMEIRELGESTIKDLSEILELDKSTLSRTVDGMLNIGLVNREIDPEDRRFMKLSLTEQGKKLADSINEKCDSYYESVFGLIPQKEHSVIVSVVETIGKTMNALRKKGCTCCGGGENEK